MALPNSLNPQTTDVLRQALDNNPNAGLHTTPQEHIARARPRDEKAQELRDQVTAIQAIILAIDFTYLDINGDRLPIEAERFTNLNGAIDALLGLFRRFELGDGVLKAELLRQVVNTLSTRIQAHGSAQFDLRIRDLENKALQQDEVVEKGEDGQELLVNPLAVENRIELLEQLRFKRNVYEQDPFLYTMSHLRAMCSPLDGSRVLTNTESRLFKTIQTFQLTIEKFLTPQEGSDGEIDLFTDL